MAKNVADVAGGARRNGNGHKPKVGLRFERYFTPPDSHAYDLVEWERRTAAITSEKGQVIFEQKDVEVPRSWSQLAINVVAQKYFRGSPGSPERETSVRQIIDRVVETLTRWGREGGYFATDEDADNWSEELRFLLVTQHASFNSPVWFNIGVPGRQQQGSACFINSVQDSMESILDLVKTEGMLFKFGSGTGTNLSVLRSSKEQLSGGGTASGPVSFMRGYDSFAGSIKSGGTTRRAAKMVILNADHPMLGGCLTGRHRLQPAVTQPDEVPDRRRHVRRRAVPSRSRRVLHRPGDPRVQRLLPHAGHRQELRSPAAAGPGLRQPWRAPDVDGAGL